MCEGLSTISIDCSCANELYLRAVVSTREGVPGINRPFIFGKTYQVARSSPPPGETAASQIRRDRCIEKRRRDDTPERYSTDAPAPRLHKVRRGEEAGKSGVRWGAVGFPNPAVNAARKMLEGWIWGVASAGPRCCSSVITLRGRVNGRIQRSGPLAGRRASGPAEAVCRATTRWETEGDNI